MKGKKKTVEPGNAPAGVDLAEIERLLAFMAEKGLEEFEYSRGDLRIRLKKPLANSHPPAPVAARAHPAPAGAGPAAEGEAGASPPETAAEAGVAEGAHITKSPIVGTFYEGPAPGAPAFVKVGDRVEVGQVLCIIEAMKLMNEIESDVAGEVVRIYVPTGQPVEYGEPLFAIRPVGKK